MMGSTVAVGEFLLSSGLSVWVMVPLVASERSTSIGTGERGSSSIAMMSCTSWSGSWCSSSSSMLSPWLSRVRDTGLVVGESEGGAEVQGGEIADEAGLVVGGRVADAGEVQRGCAVLLVLGVSHSPKADMHAQGLSDSTGRRKASFRSPWYLLLWGENSSSIRNLMLTSSVLSTSTSYMRVSSCPMLHSRVSRACALEPVSPPTQQCSLVPSLSWLQARQVHGRIFHTSGNLAKYLVMAWGRVASAQECSLATALPLDR